MIARKCDCCGKAFNARNTLQHYCCAKCQQEHYRATNRASVMKKLKQQQQEKFVSTCSSIVEIAAEARKLGLSYGKYLAMTAAREE